MTTKNATSKAVSPRQTRLLDLLKVGQSLPKTGPRKPKPVQQMSPRELRAAAPRPASALPYLRFVSSLRKRLAFLVQHYVVSELPSIISLRADSADQFSVRFANLEGAVGKLTDEGALGAKLREIADGVQEHVKDQIKSVNRIELSPKQEAHARDFVQENVRLIRKMARVQTTRIRSLVAESVQAQWSYKELQGRIQEDLGFTKARAELIARDQTLKFNAQTTEQLHRDVGITRYRWLTSQDERVRGTPGGKWPKGEHYSLNGQMFDYNNPPVVDKKTGRRANPGVDFQCRCTAVPDTDELLFGE